MSTKVKVTREGTTLDLLLWRAHGQRGAELLEATYAANLGIAAKGAILPIGTDVILPDLPAVDQLSKRKVITLFG